MGSIKISSRIMNVTVITIFAVFSFLVFYLFWRNAINNYLGILVFIVGIISWGWGLSDLGNAFGILPKARKLVTRGIYSKIRHPIYYGSLSCFIGLSIYSLNISVITWAIVLIIIQIIRIRLEERALLKKFGKSYIQYKKKTWL